MKCCLSVLLKRKLKVFETTFDLSIFPFVGMRIQYPHYTLEATYIKQIVGKKKIVAVCVFNYKQKGKSKEQHLLDTGWKQTG